ncbi:MAG: TetR/AcrR family transcriptional regulator [Bacillota bacterium]
MSKKEIQKQRIMGYFIEAAKKIIREEGIKGITARKVADLAGYSYATIYNYFSDLDTLLLYCIADFLDECHEYVINDRHPKELGIDRIKSMTESYVSYFCKNPNVFSTVFVENVGNAIPEELLNRLQPPKIALLMTEELIKNLNIAQEDQELLLILSSIASNYINGRLLVYFKREPGKDANQILSEIIKDIMELFKRFTIKL